MSNWSQPHHGVSHLAAGPCHATVEQFQTFTTWGCYDWRTHCWYAEGVVTGSNHVLRAKLLAAKELPK